MVYFRDTLRFVLGNTWRSFGGLIVRVWIVMERDYACCGEHEPNDDSVVGIYESEVTAEVAATHRDRYVHWDSPFEVQP